MLFRFVLRSLGPFTGQPMALVPGVEVIVVAEGVTADHRGWFVVFVCSTGRGGTGGWSGAACYINGESGHSYTGALSVVYETLLFLHALDEKAAP